LRWKDNSVHWVAGVHGVFGAIKFDEFVKSAKKADLSLRPVRQMAGGAKRGNLITLGISQGIATAPCASQ